MLFFLLGVAEGRGSLGRRVVRVDGVFLALEWVWRQSPEFGGSQNPALVAVEQGAAPPHVTLGGPGGASASRGGNTTRENGGWTRHGGTGFEIEEVVWGEDGDLEKEMKDLEKDRKKERTLRQKKRQVCNKERKERKNVRLIARWMNFLSGSD